MGTLLRTFTIERNAVWKTSEESVRNVADLIGRVQSGEPLGATPKEIKTANNHLGALASYIGLFRKDGDKFVTTELADVYLELRARNPVGAWQWLITRFLWRFLVPNGTSSAVNRAAGDLGIKFNFFQTLLELLVLLQSQGDNWRFLYYDEFCRLWDDDATWSRSAPEIFRDLLQLRTRYHPMPNERIGFGDKGPLETEFSIPKENFPTVFRKAFNQTGLFEYRKNGGIPVAIALSAQLDPVLQRRLRYMLDHPVAWQAEAATPEGWAQFIGLQTDDLPVEAPPPAGPEPEPEPVSVDELASEPIDDIVSRFFDDATAAGLRVSKDLVRRFIASLLAKRFVIFTGLSGSGKTKLAQGLAAWLTPRLAVTVDPFAPGTEIPSVEVTYHVHASDRLSVEFWSSQEETDAKKVVLPREMIREWADYIAEHDAEGRSAQALHDAIVPDSNFSSYQHRWKTHLKAAALALLRSQQETTLTEPGYSLIPVGADWTGTDHIVGYPDALDQTQYVRTEALNLTLEAQKHPQVPYFLILDEMNLSHVERYFADFLSAIESNEPIPLYSGANADDITTWREGVPPALCLPENLYVIGTVNVDETTYMFSPKVLDRANVIEFRLEPSDMEAFLQAPASVNLEQLSHRGRDYAKIFQDEARREDMSLGNATANKLRAELNLFFDVLSDRRAEFGFRTAREIVRFLHYYERLAQDDATEEGETFRNAMDAQIYQKILPKLSGSRRRLEPILCALGILCFRSRDWVGEGNAVALANADVLKQKAQEAAGMKTMDLHPVLKPDLFPESQAHYRKSFVKIVRMLERLEDGFTSFSEA